MDWSIPIYDEKALFEKEFDFALKTPGWLMNRVLELAGNVNEAMDLNLKKYAWQFGAAEFKSTIDKVF